MRDDTRSELVGDHDAGLGRRTGRRRAGQLGQDAMCHVADVDGARSEIGVVDGLEGLRGGLARAPEGDRRGLACRDRGARRLDDARVVEQQRLGGEDLGLGARQPSRGRGELLARAGQRRVEPRRFLLGHARHETVEIKLRRPRPAGRADREAAHRGHAAQRRAGRDFDRGQAGGGRAGRRRRRAIARSRRRAVGRVAEVGGRQLRAARRAARRRRGPLGDDVELVALAAREQRQRRSGCGRRPGRSRGWRCAARRARRGSRPAR